MKKDPIIRSFGSDREANQWAYEDGSERLYIITERVKTPFTYWVLCENAYNALHNKSFFKLITIYD